MKPNRSSRCKESQSPSTSRHGANALVALINTPIHGGVTGGEEKGSRCKRFPSIASRPHTPIHGGVNEAPRPRDPVRWQTLINGRASAATSFKLVLKSIGLVLFVASVLQAAHGQTLTADSLKKIQFNQKPGALIPLNLKFQDEHGNVVRLGDYFGRKPVILVLGYYECPMLCSVVLNGMIGSLQDMQWEIGKQFGVVNVSIAPGETPALAAAKKKAYVRRYGRPEAAQGWHFLVGAEPAIHQLADAVGFEYAYDPEVKQYAHPSGLVILTAQGKISQYLSGVAFSTPELQNALTAAASQRVGSPIRQLFLLCFQHGPAAGKYGTVIMLVVRLSGVLTLLLLVKVILGLSRQGKLRPVAPAGRVATPPAFQAYPGGISDNSPAADRKAHAPASRRGPTTAETS